MPDVILPVPDEADALKWPRTGRPDGCRADVVDNGSTDGWGHVAARLGATVIVEPSVGGSKVTGTVKGTIGAMRDMGRVLG